MENYMFASILFEKHSKYSLIHLIKYLFYVLKVKAVKWVSLGKFKFEKYKRAGY